MKYPTIDKTFVPLLFSPERNEIFRDEDDATTVSRNMTEEEKKIYCGFQFWRTWTFAMVILCWVFSLFLTVAIIAKYDKNFLVVFSWAISFSCATASTVLNSRIVDRRDDWIRERVNYGFEEEMLASEKYDNLVKEQARLWRIEHPLEEKIRKAMRSKNCVDIADVIREASAKTETHTPKYIDAEKLRRAMFSYYDCLLRRRNLDDL